MNSYLKLSSGSEVFPMNRHRILVVGLFSLLCYCHGVKAQETPALHEIFEDNRNGWSLFERPYAKSMIANGAMYMEVADGDIGFFNQKHFQLDPSKDFKLETIVEVRNFRNGSFGLVWGADEYSNYQAMDISQNGFFHIYSFKKKKVTPILRPDFLPTPLEEARKHTIVVRKTGGEIFFEFNGQLLAQAKFTPFQGTYLGFHLRGQVSVKVYEFNIYQETPEIRQAESTIANTVKENLGSKINSQYSEKGVVISADGATLYVARGEHPKNFGSLKKDDIWFSEKDSVGEWAELQNIGTPLNNSGNNFVISAAPDGNNLLVANTYLPDGRNLGGGVSLTKRSPTGWSIPENLVINDYYNNADFVDYCLSPNQNVLVMALERNDTKGDMDLYCSFLKSDNTWSAPAHMGQEVNSFAMDFSPFIAADNETLYFSSYGHPGYGSADIFVSRRLDDTWTKWTEPENLGPDINTNTWEANYTLDARGEYAYLASVQHSMGNSDIFRIPLPASARPKPVVLVTGIVLDASTGQPIEAQIKYFSLEDVGKELGQASSHPVTGRYTIILPAGGVYGFNAEREGYIPESANLNASDINMYAELQQNLLLAPINVGASVRLNNIFFNTNEAILQKESFAELDRIIKLLQAHPKMEIEIAGHTDNTGTADYNLKLSQERSQAVIDYLQTKGLSGRATAKGYGDTKPKTANETEEGRSLNRRVEIVIRKM